MRALIALLIALLGSGPVRADDNEMAALLERLLETPLDLASAQSEDLAALPWLDDESAAAIVGLRELGELRRWSDLTKVPGLGRADIAALEPFLTLRSSVAGAQWRWETQLRSGARRPPQERTRTALLSEHYQLLWMAHRRDGERVQGGSAMLDLGWLRVVGGGARSSMGWSMLDSDGVSRSRTGPLSPSNAMDLRLSPRVSSAQSTVSMGARIRGQRWRGLLLQRGASDLLPARWVLGADVSLRGEGDAASKASEGRLGAALQVSAGRAVPSLWCFTRGAGAAGRLQWLRGAGGGSVVAVALRATRERLSWGMAWTDASGIVAEGLDPLSGRRLTSPQRSMQVDAGLRSSAGSLRLLLRRLERVGDRVDERVEFTAVQRSGENRLRIRARLDANGAASPGFQGLQFDARLERHSDAFTQWSRLAQRWTLGARRRLLGTGLRGATNPRWALALDYADGTSPSLSVLSSPGVDAVPIWLIANELHMSAGVEYSVRGLRFALAAGLRVGPKLGALPRFAIALRRRE